MAAFEAANAEFVSTVEHEVSTEVDKGYGQERFAVRIAKIINRQPLLFLPVWILAFFAAIWPTANRLLWYDELLTYYGATAPSLTRFWEGIAHFDFTPPLQYILVRFTLWLCGDSPLATRLPSILAFLAASLILFWFVARRSGGGFGFLTMGLSWCTGFFPFATEARPYALELLFCATAFTAWSHAARQTTWTWFHAALCAAIAGLFLSHCFAPVFLLPLICGELTRSRETRRFDRNIWIALLLPLPLAAIYLPFLQKPSHILFPFPALATIDTIGEFYVVLFLSILVPGALSVAAALLVFPPRQKVHLFSIAPRYEWVCLLSGLLAPMVQILYTIHARIAYQERYGIGVAAPVTILGVFAVELISRRSKTAAALGAFLVLVNFTTSHISQAQNRGFDSATAMPPNLPIVVASGARFLELDHYQSGDVVRRLYYLTDYKSAVSYTHATVYEEFGQLHNAYPVRARVLSYPAFMREHSRFFVVALQNNSYQDWLLPKLRAEGARIQRAPNSTWLYDVRIGR